MPTRLIAEILAAFLIIGGGWVWHESAVRSATEDGRVAGEKTGRDAVRKQWDEAKLAEIQIQETEKARERAQQLAAQKESDRANQETIAQLRTAAADSAGAADRLRQRVAALVGTVDARDRAERPAAAASGVSAPAVDNDRMLADVLGSTVEISRRLAAIADGRGAAGADCERRYDALTRGAEGPPLP